MKFSGTAATGVENRPLRRLGFLTIGLFDPERPGEGHEETLRVNSARLV